MLAMLLAAALAPFGAMARGPEASHHFNLPAQPLDRALLTYGRITGLAVLVDARLLANLHSAEVIGRYRDDEALRRMLVGTGLTPRFVGDDAFTLVMSGADTAVDEPAPETVAPVATDNRDAAVRRRGARILQRSLEDALCGDESTRPGGYRAAIRFRLDASGRIRQAEISESSGDVLRDAAILARLADLPLTGLPPDLPQPITLTLLPETGQSTPPCRGRER